MTSPLGFCDVCGRQTQDARNLNARCDQVFGAERCKGIVSQSRGSSAHARPVPQMASDIAELSFAVTAR